MSKENTTNQTNPDTPLAQKQVILKPDAVRIVNLYRGKPEKLKPDGGMLYFQDAVNAYIKEKNE